jgi:hypothetical protein
MNTHDFTKLDRVELLERKQKLDSEIADIKQQLEQARLVKHLTGQYADRDWYIRANAALRHKGQESQAIQIALSRLKTQKKERPDTLEGRFVEIARQKLADEVFTDILSEARELIMETE